MNKVLVILALFINSLCFSQRIIETKTKYVNPEFETETKNAKALVTDLMKEKSIPGLSITVASKNKILWSEGFGLADLENKTPIKLNSKFRIGSISKSLTSIALGKLIEKGKINLSDTVQKLVPYFPKKKYQITIQELASHTSGIRNYNYKNGEYFSNVHYNTIKESIDIFKEDSLLFEPKTKYGYSTYGYVLLSAAIEEVAGQNFLDYMQNNVFEPMGMYSTVPDLNDKIIDNRVQFYQLRDGTIINASYIDNSNKWAGGGFLSSSLDLAKMSQHLLRKDIINKRTIELLWTPTQLADGERTNYCLGWRRDVTESGNIYIHHGGSSVGGRSFLLIYPKDEIIVSITCNLFTRFNESLALEIAEKFKK
ncbi:serine hydrolase domain-containing protein [Flagellimonas meridianipacifica]|uniref:CubicO group peptidase (Beta-lactamase class C family) n=1 Tax=Flagellimonas meridianipacifica TaxID=1080225 RepID=A0A2T0MI17_9FLAO|nr:serine hydrolase domain-containing protein [Allomuricauda pacifica]PRX57214.1 CubicO group peptidase (beta-lactamase class C family) [Allomuricauda pacifica]